VIFQGSSSACRAQSKQALDRSRFAEWAIHDVKDWVATSSLKRLKHTAISVALLAPLTLIDERISDHTDRADGYYGDFLNVANEFGGPNAVWIPVGLFSASLMTKNERFQDAAFTSLQATVYAYFITVAGKRVFVGRSRPYEEMGPHEFQFFSNNNSSFPSGHATTAWAIVTPWMFYYPHPITYSLALIAGGTAMSRMQRHQHWMTDVVAGSALGFMTGYWLSNKHQQNGQRLTVSVSPGLSSSSATISISF